MCDRISTWLKDAAVENGPIPLGARALATRMRDLGTGCTRPDISWCGERRTPCKGLALDRNEIIAETNAGGTQQENICDLYDDVTDVGAPSSPAPSAHRFAAAGLDRAPKSVTKSYQDR